MQTRSEYAETAYSRHARRLTKLTNREAGCTMEEWPKS